MTNAWCNNDTYIICDIYHDICQINKVEMIKIKLISKREISSHRSFVTYTNAYIHFQNALKWNFNSINNCISNICHFNWLLRQSDYIEFISSVRNITKDIEMYVDCFRYRFQHMKAYPQNIITYTYTILINQMKMHFYSHEFEIVSANTKLFASIIKVFIKHSGE